MAASKSDTAFLGHPSGLGWLSFSEFWERFSYYSMQALLVLYLTHSLFLPGHIEHVLGIDALRHLIQLFYRAPLTSEQLASNINGIYTGTVYLTPLFGGLIADRLIGRTWAVTVGALLMAAGQFLMTMDATFLAALAFLLVGVGFFKGNIATQVGDLYGEDDPRRADAFQVYMFGIQLAVILSPLVSGTVGEKVDYHWGFALAGFGMLIGLATYIAGRRALPPEKPRTKAAKQQRAPFTPTEKRNLAILVFLIPVLAVALIGNQQIGNAYLLWVPANFLIVWHGHTMPISWMLSLDAVISAILIAASVAFWRWWATRWAEPDELMKIVIGVMIAALAPLVLALASAVVAATGHPVSLIWAIAFHAVNDLGFANVFPIGLALYTRASPKGFTGAMIGIFYLHLFFGNLLVGWLGGFLQKMPGVQFWLMHAGLMAASAAVLLLVKYTVGHTLAPEYAAPKEG